QLGNLFKKVTNGGKQDNNKGKGNDNGASKYQNALNTLTEEQRWGIEQLISSADAPTLPWPMADEDPHDGIIPQAYLTFMEGISNISMDSIQSLSAALNARYMYNKRVISLTKGLQNRFDDFTSKGMQCHFKLDSLEKEQECYKYFHAAGSRAHLFTFYDLQVQPNTEGVMVATADSRMTIPYGGTIAKVNGKWMFMQSASSQKTTYLVPKDVKICEDYIQTLVKLQAMLTVPESEKQETMVWKTAIGQKLIREAIANNSKDNIVYVNYPQASSLNASLRNEALKVFKAEVNDKVLDVIVGGDWEYAYNIFGNVIKRRVKCYVVVESPVAKSVGLYYLGNDKVGSGWGNLRWDGVVGFVGYVK
ncbi:MAG: hypothetical protein J5606_00275, partial [Bacteroidales bacterium]|nr:hypothetical protein [Bacteroidales bacterium]